MKEPPMFNSGLGGLPPVTEVVTDQARECDDVGEGHGIEPFGHQWRPVFCFSVFLLFLFFFFFGGGIFSLILLFLVFFCF